MTPLLVFSSTSSNDIPNGFLTLTLINFDGSNFNAIDNDDDDDVNDDVNDVNDNSITTNNNIASSKNLNDDCNRNDINTNNLMIKLIIL
jgi:hypothetical protein